MICSNSKKSERVGYVEEGSSGWGQAAGSACQSKLEELGEALREVKAAIQHSSHQTDWSLNLNWRKNGWCLLIVNVISRTAEFVLNLECLDRYAVCRPLAREDTEEDG